ncbi:hypothetical protein TCAL_00837 [Tigriopus californicus]|uniref:t-SNARE coiled-coil homology domain-containing protein n=1 Tax=Tigriopus californicus TaxID=6832 RepID=A0A553NCY4_TIGCA|nr:syntaxin-6-like [Tigriopus californicus]TRY63297.1 hypothetical protein TCAL_00837 [Tigriopus californicus]|eukprot:TCALIF_00837-PA protein Name:"Similar to Stx6 Syntaxin-6 (Mus musculus)" AED:0.07 eAED:0.07 QI:371/1/1/1/1/1/4/572/266
MTTEDPFFVVKDEVLRALIKTRQLYEHWCSVDEGREIQSIEEQEWSATELRNALRSIEWDLEDLDDTVQIVEKNPSKFRMDATELMVRKSFIAQTRDEVLRMKKRTTEPKPTINECAMEQVSLSSPGQTSGQIFNNGGGTGSTKYSRLPNDIESPSKDSGSNGFAQGGLLQQQKRVLHDQDEQLHVMSESMSNIRHMSHHIGSELDEQAVMLDEFGTEIENAETKLDATMRKMAKVLHMSNDRRQWMAIGFLAVTVFVLLLLIFAF